MRVFAACAVVLAGCAQISGLDVLDVADATAPADGAVDARETDDAGNVADARVDAGDAPGIVDSAKDALKEASPPGPCTKPADCPGVPSICCETLVTSGQNSSTCTLDADTIACAPTSACATSIDFSCGKDIVRRCATNSDCTEQGYKSCCTIPANDASTRQVCLSSGLAVLLGGTCM